MHDANYQGKLSGKAESHLILLIVETCVFPTLLYGVENWIMSAESITILKCFEREVANHILQLPKWYSNIAAIVPLERSSLHVTCTIQNRGFLHRVMTNEANICQHTFTAMVDNIEALSLVREGRELEERHKLSFTSQILNVNDSADSLIVVREAQEYIIKED